MNILQKRRFKNCKMEMSEKCRAFRMICVLLPFCLALCMFFSMLFLIQLSLPARGSEKEHINNKELVNKSIDRLLKNYYYYGTDYVILASWIQEHHPHPGLAKYVSDAYPYLLAHPDNFNPNLFRLAFKEHPLVKPLCNMGSHDNEMDCLILRSLWCDVEKPKNTFLDELEKTYRNYALKSNVDMVSHVLLVASELEERNCFSKNDIDKLKTRSACFILDWISNKKVSYGEGVAFLIRTGYGSFVKEEWVESIRETLIKKLKSGYSGGSEPHDTLLEIYALAQWQSFLDNNQKEKRKDFNNICKNLEKNSPTTTNMYDKNSVFSSNKDRGVVKEK